MNYTLIIILIVLLFVIYQLRTSEKKEGFAVTNDSVYSTCPSGYVLNGSGTSATCKDYTDNSRCPSGYNYGTIRINNSNSKYCVKSEDDYKLTCPSGFIYETSTGKCRKAQTYPTCPAGTNNVVGLGNENKCRKFGINTLQPTCSTDKINPKNGDGVTVTERCCPSSKPWYQNKQSGPVNARGFACRTNKL